jgi:PTH2 family peptidyl-tRNA hydrolase
MKIPMETKMVIVVREELGLSPGKAAVQVAHAAVMLALEGKAKGDKMVDKWLAEGQRKVALKAWSLAEMEELRKKAQSLGLRALYVEDAGLTEVPAGTKTVLGIGPSTSREIDKVTGELSLL